MFSVSNSGASAKDAPQATFDTFSQFEDTVLNAADAMNAVRSGVKHWLAEGTGRAVEEPVFIGPHAEKWQALGRQAAHPMSPEFAAAAKDLILAPDGDSQAVMAAMSSLMSEKSFLPTRPALLPGESVKPDQPARGGSAKPDSNGPLGNPQLSTDEREAIGGSSMIVLVLGGLIALYRWRG